jgi:hypothetical protein
MVQCPLCQEFVDELLSYDGESMCPECVDELDAIEQIRREEEREMLKQLEDLWG